MRSSQSIAVVNNAVSVTGVSSSLFDRIHRSTASKLQVESTSLSLFITTGGKCSWLMDEWKWNDVQKNDHLQDKLEDKELIKCNSQRSVTDRIVTSTLWVNSECVWFTVCSGEAETLVNGTCCCLGICVSFLRPDHCGTPHSGWVGNNSEERARCKTSYGESGLITYCFIDKLSRAWRKCCVFITGVERHILSLPPLFLSLWNKERKKIEKRVRTVNSHSGEVSVQQRESDVTG